MPEKVDRFLGGALEIFQPQEGFRSGSDAVFLSAIIPSSYEGTVLDVGCGSGVVSLCASFRCKNGLFFGIDKQKYLVEIAQKNSKLNCLESRTTFIAEDLLNTTLKKNRFDCVLTNPPYYDFRQKIVSDKNMACFQSSVNLENWIKNCIQFVRPSGYFCMIYPAQYVEKALYAMRSLGEIVLYPLWPKKEMPAKRVILRGKKNSRAVTRFSQGLVLHEQDGHYTEKAKKILWDGDALDLLS